MTKAQESRSSAVRAPLWLLVLVTLSGTTAMHIFMPALPLAGSDLQASSASMQQTITLYIIGLAVGQLIYGPISDTIGRRPTLLVGLAIYLVSSVFALVAPTLEWLLIARLAQALGGAAGITLGRAIVRDTSAPEQVAKDLALLNLLTPGRPGARTRARLVPGGALRMARHLRIPGRHRQRDGAVRLAAAAGDPSSSSATGLWQDRPGLRPTAG